MRASSSAPYCRLWGNTEPFDSQNNTKIKVCPRQRKYGKIFQFTWPWRGSFNDPIIISTTGGNAGFAFWKKWTLSADLTINKFDIFRPAKHKRLARSTFLLFSRVATDYVAVCRRRGWPPPGLASLEGLPLGEGVFGVSQIDDVAADAVPISDPVPSCLRLYLARAFWNQT